jgi:hypothetical protein
VRQKINKRFLKMKKTKNKVQKGLRKGKEKSQHVLTTLVSTGTGRDEKDTLISAPSIQMGALVGLGWVGFHPRTRLFGWWAGR